MVCLEQDRDYWWVMVADAANAIPTGACFSTGQRVSVTDGAGVTRDCKLESWRAVGPLWQIAVVDVNEGA